jgi:FAD/FMN-containing dehydrogenase
MNGSVAERLRRTLDGWVTMPVDTAYDAERTTFNATIDRRPAAIVRAKSTGDVMAAVRAASDEGLPIAVRGGGHSVAGHSVADGALVIDLRDYRTVAVDPIRRTVRVAGGAQWDDVDAATWEHGLAVVGGTFGDTGVAGLTLGGGIGWLNGTQGFSCDNLIRAELVTAGGELVVAGSDGDPDLLWALRGGGGNFGVVTSFEFRIADPGPIIGGYVRYPIEDTERVLRTMVTVMDDAPDQLEIMGVVRVHDEAATPDEPNRVGVGIAWTGSARELDEVIRPLRSGFSILEDGITPKTYLELQAMNGTLPFGLRHYWKGHFLRTLDDAAIGGVLGSMDAPVGAQGLILIEAIHGVASREPEGGAAFGQRAAGWNGSALAIWEDEAHDAGQIAWARATADRFGVSSLTGAGYANYSPVDETPDRIKLAFGPDRFARLKSVKRHYDPANLFRFNLNIAPD